MRRFSRSLLLHASLLVAAQSLAAPSAPDPRAPGFSQSIDVSVIDLVVLARDGKGRPVQGLKAENFRVRVDGRVEPVVNFAEVIAPAPTPASPRAPSAERPAPPTAPGPTPRAVATPAGEPTHIVVLFDNLHLHPGSRDKAIEQIEGALLPLLSTGQTAVKVVAFFRELEVLLPFSRLSSDVQRGLARVSRRGGGAAATMSERDRLHESLNSSAAEVEQSQRHQGSDGAEYQAMLAMVESYAGSEEFELRLSLDALASTIESIGPIPGRKAVLYVSDSLALSPGEDAYAFLDQVFPSASARLDAMRLDRTRDFKEVTSRANAMGVTLYVLSPSRPQYRGIVTAERAKGNDPRYRGMTLDDLGQTAMQRAAELLADDTGGMAIVGRGDLAGALAKVRSDFESYYSLGVPSPPASDVVHDIEVEVVDAPEVRSVRYRRGHTTFTDQKRIENAVLARLDFEGEENPLGLTGRLETVERKPDGEIALAIRLRIPWKNLLLREVGDSYRGELVARLAFKDWQGLKSGVRTLSQPLMLPSKYYAKAQGDSYTYSVELSLPPGSWTISLAITDMLGESTSYLRFERLLTR